MVVESFRPFGCFPGRASCCNDLRKYGFTLIDPPSLFMPRTPDLLLSLKGNTNCFQTPQARQRHTPSRKTKASRAELERTNKQTVTGFPNFSRHSLSPNNGWIQGERWNRSRSLQTTPALLCLRELKMQHEQSGENFHSTERHSIRNIIATFFQPELEILCGNKGHS